MKKEAKNLKQHNIINLLKNLKNTLKTKYYGLLKMIKYQINYQVLKII